jgi:type I restriction enzyme R subunit
LKISNFEFLKKEFPLLSNIGEAAEANCFSDPVTALFKLRQFGEKILFFIFEAHALDFPVQVNFHNCLIDLKNENILPERVLELLFSIKNKGNIAVHENKGNIADAKTIIFAAFKVAKWFYETYSNDGINISQVKFSELKELIDNPLTQKLEKEYKLLEQKYTALISQKAAKTLSESEKDILSKRSINAAKKIELNEAETRILIDEQLKLAGWEVDTTLLNYKTNKTLPEKGRSMAIAEWPCSGFYADYALFVGTELIGVVEAKKYANDISTDLYQSKRYSENVTTQGNIQLVGTWKKYNIPFLFSANGRQYLEQLKTKSGIWFLDIRNNRNKPRALQGWFSPEGLKALLKQDISGANTKLKTAEVDYLASSNGLGLRKYQLKAIQAVEQAIANDIPSRKVLLEMATGTGKTRTILGLCYRLIKANRFKRILFLVDRNLLANQSFDTFKDTKVEDFLSFFDNYKISELKETIPDFESRLHFATVQGMVKRLFYSAEDANVLPVDTYDCIIVDEAHRGYLQDKEMDDEELNFKDQRDYVSKYRKVLDYFDAFGVGLTATPALHTTQIFGKAVYTYSYREAVVDGFLIDHDPPFKIKTQLSEDGISWKKGEKPKVFDKESNTIQELDELEDELNIDVAGFNKQVITESFNKTVLAALATELDPESDEKTLIFAATDEHADRVVALLTEAFENMGVDVPHESIMKITGKIDKPQEWVRKYKNEKYPTIVVTVDLLTTGVDVPKICNIVFMRRIKSRILFEQMLGRATRRCDEINKESFRIFDAVKVYESLEDYSTMKPVSPNPSTTFVQLIDEIPMIETEARLQRQIDQIIAKFHRKKRLLANIEDRFAYKANGIQPDDFVDYLKDLTINSMREELPNMRSAWVFLDELKPGPSTQLFSDHEDNFIGMERGYGKAKKPEDYLEGMKRFIEENRNKISALNVICSRPKELDRQSLKELKLLLDEAGYNTRTLNAAWKATKNEDIAADIISFIRTFALGSSLVSHEQRIKNAMSKVRQLKSWNKVQEKWIERFEKQLLQEEVIQVEDLNLDPFNEAGGYERLNKIFEHDLKSVLDVMNENLYSA